MTSVWRPLEYQPGYVVLAEALERHVGEEAGVMMRSPFPAWHEADLRTLARDAGFGEVSVALEIGSVRYPSAEEFVRREAASSPLAESIGAAEQDVRDALVSAVEGGLEDETNRTELRGASEIAALYSSIRFWSPSLESLENVLGARALGESPTVVVVDLVVGWLDGDSGSVWGCKFRVLMSVGCGREVGNRYSSAGTNSGYYVYDRHLYPLIHKRS